MTGVSYMIPFVAAGGLLIALSFLLGGYEIVGPYGDIAVNNTLFDLPDPAAYGLDHALFDSGLMAYIGALFFIIGKTAFALFIPAFAGYIAYAIADRPGIAPGFVMGGLRPTCSTCRPRATTRCRSPRPASSAPSSAASSPVSWRTGWPSARCRPGPAA